MNSGLWTTGPLIIGVALLLVGLWWEGRRRERG